MTLFPRTTRPGELATAMRAYVEHVREIVAEPLSVPATVRKVGQASAELLSEGLELDAAFRAVPEGGYGRNLVHKDPEAGFVVLAMVWPPGLSGPPHDHGTWGVVAVAEGEVVVTDYEREDDGSTAGRAVLRECGTLRAGPGGIATVLPPHRDFHAVANASGEVPALTLHTYGREICRCHVVDLATGAMEPSEAHYHNIVAPA